MRERFAMIDVFNQLYDNGQNGIECQQFEKYLQQKFVTMDINMLTPKINPKKKSRLNKRVSFNTSQNKLSLYTPSPP